MGFGTNGLNNIIQQTLAQGGNNMTGMAGMPNMTETEYAYNKSANVILRTLLR